MIIELQVCNEKLSDRLKELGVSQNSLYYHTKSEKWGVMPKKSIDFSGGGACSAYNCSELIAMCENWFGLNWSEREKCFYSGYAISNNIVYYKTFADALATKLIECIEREWFTIEEVNARLNDESCCKTDF